VVVTLTRLAHWPCADLTGPVIRGAQRRIQLLKESVNLTGLAHWPCADLTGPVIVGAQKRIQLLRESESALVLNSPVRQSV